MRLKAVVFDLDGTLVDSTIDYERMSVMIRDVLAKAGVSPEHLTDRRKIYQIIRGGDKALGGMGIATNERTQIMDEMVRIMNQVELEGVHLSKPMRNAHQTLRKLRGKGLGIGIATRGCHEYAIKSMQLTKIDNYVDILLARDDVPHPKPDPRHLLEVLNHFRVERQNVFYVGDTTTDLDTAVAAKIDFIGYKRNEEWGKRLLDAGCQRIVDDLIHLVDLIENY